MKTLLFGKHTSARRPGILLAGAVALMLAHGVAMAGIATSKHDLSSTGAFNKFTPTAGNSEICAFCHTPHGADTAAVVPLWNRKLGAPASYTTYAALGTTTLDGATAPVGSVSLACLSCHDGTQAMNTVINAPGSGGYDAAGALWAGTWTAGSAVATTGTLNYASIVNIGTDLRNDHPVGIQYAGGGYLSSANLNQAAPVDATGTKGDADFTTPKVTSNATTATFWVDTGTAGRQKTDLILYTRTEATVGGVAQPFVECASCHDPHSAGGTAPPTFLRTTNANSALCLACHTK